TTISKGTYTTCAPDSNGWQLSGRHIFLDRDSGWGEASNIVMRVKGMPILWLPWITFPIDDRRKTGLLFPTFAIGDSGGLDITQPIYINIHPQMDATVAPRYIDGRGSGIDSEFRYLSHLGEGKVSYGVLFNDRKFNNRNREVARWNHNGNIGRWGLSTDVNYVSDDFYFKDLDTGLEVSSQTHLPLLGQAHYYGRTWDFLARLQSWQTIDPTLSNNALPYRRLPQLQLSGDPKLAGPLKALWLSDLTVFDISSSATNRPTGTRLHLAPALTLPLRTSWGYVEPRARVYHNRYQLDGASGQTGNAPTLTTWGASLDSGLFFERPAKLFGQTYTQTLEPRLFINHVAYKDQSALPNFDTGERTFSYNTLFQENRFIGYDRIGDEDKASLGLTSRFLRDATGREQLRLRLGQGFYLRDRRVTLNRKRTENPTDTQTPVVGDARWNFGKDWYLYTEGQWDAEQNQRRRSSFQVGFNDRERRVFNVGYHERPEDNIRESEVSAILPIRNNWRLIGRWMYDLQNQRTLETIAGAEYRNCCLKVRMLSQRELVDNNGNGQLQPNSTFWLQIQLTGLGGFGGQVDSLLERSIPGYRREYE
ncbi:MAG: LPS assembly protein LptD, partial [Alcanivorax sp.]|nr:LPS assembly protein LptD [Alcanivorax sp.]